MSLGNHEFDEAVDGLIPFIRNVTTPVLAANLILDKVPELQHETNLLPSVVITINKVKIGIIGYLTAETKFLAPKNNVEYEDEVIAIKREVSKLKKQGVNIFIALGHSGFLKDLEIAKDVEGLDLVIGGHSNTFLTNKMKINEKPEVSNGSYPVEVKQPSGKIVRVVQAYAYTKYLGKLHLTFDRFGKIIECDGEPILLDKSIPRDPEVLKMVEKYKVEIDRENNVVLGTAYSPLRFEHCRLRECNIGVVITDAILSHTRETYSYPDDIKIAIVQGGRIRASIYHPEKPFNMTMGDWITVLPFTDFLTLIRMNGSVLRQSLEHAVEDWKTVDTPGQFLQFAGMNVTYDLARPVGSRVVKAKAACLECENELAEIQDHLEYKLIMSEFLADGGDGYVMFEKLEKEILPFNEVDCLIDYLGKSGPINQGYTGRITVLNEDKIANIHANPIMSDQPSAQTNLQSSVLICIVATLICLNV